MTYDDMLAFVRSKVKPGEKFRSSLLTNEFGNQGAAGFFKKARKKGDLIHVAHGWYQLRHDTFRERMVKAKAEKAKQRARAPNMNDPIIRQKWQAGMDRHYAKICASRVPEKPVQPTPRPSIWQRISNLF